MASEASKSFPLTELFPAAGGCSVSDIRCGEAIRGGLLSPESGDRTM
jgi:hypothetical protein